ncbi:hypothetical protein WICMUC_000509 [Wickerhamomyces mucosus]|uniref:Uncharacterized protein n=1 Tax=Wickerhamomyces mucosus TaxID=1378264 RepID=A0A9P8PXF7_9ASCO|nr:hypothetical protein WICMUC_000509 [Wickerhamomyces mucosus]
MRGQFLLIISSTEAFPKLYGDFMISKSANNPKFKIPDDFLVSFFCFLAILSTLVILGLVGLLDVDFDAFVLNDNLKVKSL